MNAAVREENRCRNREAEARHARRNAEKEQQAANEAVRAAVMAKAAVKRELVGPKLLEAARARREKMELEQTRMFEAGGAETKEMVRCSDGLYSLFTNYKGVGKNRGADWEHLANCKAPGKCEHRAHGWIAHFCECALLDKCRICLPIHEWARNNDVQKPKKFHDAVALIKYSGDMSKVADMHARSIFLGPEWEGEAEAQGEKEEGEEEEPTQAPKSSKKRRQIA